MGLKRFLILSLLVLTPALVSFSQEPAAPQPATAAPAPLPTTSAVFAPAPAPLPAAVASTTTGTLRIDDGLAAQRVYLDGVPLKASATELQCGPHDIAVGAPTRARRVDVPCGGDITVFR